MPAYSKHQPELDQPQLFILRIGQNNKSVIVQFLCPAATFFIVDVVPINHRAFPIFRSFIYLDLRSSSQIVFIIV